MMHENRIIDHPVLGPLTDRKIVTFQFDGTTFQGYEGETIAAALMANGIRTLRVHEEKGTPRGIYCNIGHCFECRVSLNGVPSIRACLTEIQEGMNIESGKQLPSPVKELSKHLPVQGGNDHV